jgi:CheY-like chemotaxis protein
MTTGRSVLLVDDNVDLAENLRELMEDEGLEVQVAVSGSDALARLDSFRPDLVVTDMRMPGVSGVELLRHVRARWPEVPVVLITAWSHDRMLEEARRDGALAVLPKPIDLGQLLGAVERVLSPDARRVLVVEDTDDLRADLVETLQSLETVVPYPAASAREAERIAEALRIDAAVLDVHLPDGDGLTLGEGLRSPTDPGLPLVIVTGYDLDPEALRRLASDRTRVLEKPVLIGTLIETLAELLRCDSNTPAS